MATLPEIITSNYRVVTTGLTSGQATKQVEAIKYIQELAGLMGVNADRWNVTQLFHNPETKRILTDRRKINRIFMHESSKVESVKKVTSLSEQQIKAISDFELQVPPRNADQRLDAARFHWDRYITYKQNADTELGNYHKKMEEYRQMLFVGHPVLAGKVAEIVETGHFEFLGVQVVTDDPICGRVIRPRHELVFATERITLTHKNETAGINCVVDIGKLKVCVDVRQGFVVRVFPYENNVKAMKPGADKPFYHPHVYALSGDVCYGALSDQYEGSRRDSDLFTIMDLTRSLLLSYNDSDPYISLTDMEAAARGVSADCDEDEEVPEEEVPEEVNF